MKPPGPKSDAIQMREIRERTGLTNAKSETILTTSNTTRAREGLPNVRGPGADRPAICD
jgi:hypothetical protein